MPESAKNILQTYLRRLTNLSGNNRSLLLLKLHAEQLMDLHDFNFLNNQEHSFEIIKSLITRKAKRLCQVLDSRLEANNEVSKKLKKLQRIDRFLFEERGSNDLHVGWPFVQGKFADGTMVRCPLIYFPVSIVQKGQFWELQPREDAGITFNKSFLLSYAYYNKVSLDENLVDQSFEDFDVDSTVFRTQLYELLKDRIEINFNRDNFQDDLVAFTAIKKSDFDAGHRNGELKLFPKAVLGIFPQAGSQLVQDYLHLLEEDSFGDLENFFLSRNKDEAATSIKEEKLFTPFVLDAYQENAIVQVKKGNSIVVQGPPGTGKSQLICNLLADAMAAGKKALLVCQKRAALDVVYERMKSIGLENFMALIHDYRNDRKEIFGKVAKQIDQLEEYKAKNRTVDVIQTERKFLQICRRIDHIIEELEEFKIALFNDSECGLPVKELYLTSSASHAVVNLKQEYKYFSFDNLEPFLRRLKVYANYATLFERKDYILKGRKSFAKLQPSHQKEIENVLIDLPQYQNKLSSSIFRLLGVNLNLVDCENMLSREPAMLEMINLLEDDETYSFFKGMINEADEKTNVLWLSNVERVIMNCYEDEGPETSAPTSMLGKYQEALHERMQARKNIFKLLMWELFSKKKFLIKRLLVANDLAYNKYGMQVLEQRLDCRLNLEHHLTNIKNKSWLVGLPENYKQENLAAWFRKQILAIRAKLSFSSLREIKEAINVENLTRTEFISLIKNLLSIARDLPERKNKWLEYLSPYEVNLLIHQPEKAKDFIAAIQQDFDNLCEFDQSKDELTTYERDVIYRLYEHTGIWDPVQMTSLFQNSLRLSWLDHLETKYPSLRSVSSLKMDQLQLELQENVMEKQKLAEQLLVVRARERAYEGVSYNRLHNRITYRDLYHQVTKKKKIWPVRKVIAEHYDELFQLTPCWLTSPESVSAIFPMEQLFDVVIFDEASQCFAERGVPAMYRGKQIVVAGDDQQLKPNELYQVRWDEDNENPDSEVESLLELGARYLPTVHLQAHYRSKSLELIEFSNQHFYENRLRLLPDRNVMNVSQSAIEYCKVEGHWENQTNILEANEVVKRVLQLLRQEPLKEIGIVTFNAPQQLLIMDLLESEAALYDISIPNSLFIKNIENVQGDEKDIIIFSIGYAPDKKGKMMMQFGSLNASGGENRLNVAVTRAREKIILFTSIWPEQLKTDDLKNRGPKLLKKYLEFARDASEKRFSPSTTNNYENGTSYLAHHLQQWAEERLKSYEFETNVLPYADLNVRHTDRYLGIILTDDLRYSRSVSVKDAYAYVPALLTQKNWKYKMIYSRNFWKDLEKVESDLLLFVGNQQH